MRLSSTSTLVKNRKLDILSTRFKPWGAKPRRVEMRIKPINSVGQILSTIQNVPKTAVLLGKCPDGMPIFLDLVASSIGAVLVTCDKGYGKTHQLQVMVESGIKLNAGKDIQVAVISKNPWEWDTSLKNHPNNLALGCYAWHEGDTERLISDIYNICEERLNEPNGSKNILLVLDDLGENTKLDQDSRLALEWLLDYGPKVNIWPIASLNSTSLIDKKMINNSFKTNIIGKFGKKNSFSRINQICIDTSNFDPGEFSIMIKNQWMTYRLPMLGK